MRFSAMEATKEYFGTLINPKQIRALLWKDLLVRLRQPWMTTLQFVWPVFLFISLYLLRMRFSSAEIAACQFPTRQLPNKADVLPFFQSYICTIDNKCIDPAVYEETSSLNEAPVTPILNIVQTFLNEPLLFDALVSLPETANFLGAVTAVATHPKFKYLEHQMAVIQERIPEYEGKVGTSFDIQKVWSDGDTFATFGNILCGKPFPRSENIPLVERAFYHEDYNGPDQDELDTMPTPYCKQLYLDVTNTNQGKITWNQVKPIIQGKIVYGPDSVQTRQIMAFANGTFEGILRLKTFLISLDTIVTKLRTEEDFRDQLVKLIDLVKTPIVQSIIGVMAIDTKAIDSIFDALIHDESIPVVLTTVSNILGCFNVDRFHVVKDAAEMEAVAIEMNDKKLFYAGIFFDGDGNYTDKRNVSYTIRMDIDNTPKTIENRNRFYFPGPEGSFAEDLRYHKGFIEWQHAVDTGIIKMFKDEKVKRLGLAKAGMSEQEADKELSLDDDFFDDADDDDNFSLPTYTTPDTTTEYVPSFEFDEDAAKETPFDPDVESFLEFEDEGDRGNRTKRQFSGLLDSLFNTNDESAEEDGVTTFDMDQLHVFTKMFPYPKYVQDDFKKGLYMANAVQVAFFFSLLVQIAAAVRQRLWMKESGNRRLMQAMGLNKSSDPIAWAITTLIEIAITFFLCCLVLYGGGILDTSSKWYVAFLLLLFGLSVLSFCYMATSFFTTASIGSVSSSIIFLSTFMPYVVIISVGTSLSYGLKFILNLSVSTAFCFAWHQLMRMELQQIPLTFEHAFEGTMATNDLKFGMFMLVLDTILYALAGFLYAHFSTDEYQFYEVAVKDMDATIGAELKNVTKTFEGAAKPSLNSVSMTFRRDQVTCLLGRNGAGKSTIIKLLTGQIRATAGRVFLPQNVDRITGDEHKERVGLCPQANVLIPNLTAKEHLQMYAAIKMEGGEAKEVERVMEGLEFGLHEDFASENLSGGFQRRLNIGIAFIGSPNLVILDEPCNAIDTKTRKSIWETIKVLRKGRAVIMATHFLDEAEHLSDSVLIMNDGVVIGENSPSSLKHEFTKSFTIKIELIDSPMQRTTIEDIRRHFAELTPSHSIEDMHANVFELNVAYYAADQKYYNFGPLVGYLEEMQRTNQIVGFKVHSNDLEGIFNGLIQSHEASGDAPAGEANGRIDACNGANQTKVTYYENLSTMTVIANLFWKRFKHFRRNFRLIICVLVLPTVFVALAMAFMTIRPPGEFDVALPMGPQLYPDSEEFYSLETSNPYDEQVYGALADNDSLAFNTSEDVFRWLIVGDGQNGYNRYGGISLNGSTAAVWYNNKGYHSMPSYLNQLNNALFNVEMNATKDEKFHIRTVNHPMKLGKDELSASSVLQKIADAGISIILLVAFSLVIAGSSIYIVNERISGEKLQQRLAGVKFHTYWGVCFVWDMAVYGLAIALAVVVMVWFDIPAYTAKDNLGGICLLLAMYGFATIPMVHLFEKMFNDASLANMHILCLNIIIGLLTRTVVILIDLLGESETSHVIRDFLNRLFLVFPQYALTDGLVEVCQNHILAVVFERYYIDTYQSPLTSKLLLPHLVSLFVFGVVFAAINYTIESGIIHRVWHRVHRIIKGERREFLNIVPLTDATKLHRLGAAEKSHTTAVDSVVRVDNLYKIYGNGHQALGGVSFHVNRGECFGLLGANGAGKSTIFAILSGQHYQTSGTVQWFDRKGVSYCPQSNALDMLLTVSETIHFYGTLRKVVDVQRLEARTLRQFHLGQYANVLVKNLSGGNRRKLSVACTCFGDTSLVLMDEPTSDMDPITRTMTYACIRALLLERRSVILTSHTITEIDRVCDRIGVLRRGQMLSTGAPAALQKMYGISYVVTVFCDRGGEGGGTVLERDLRAALPGLEALVVHNHCVQFSIRILPVGDEIINGRSDRDHSKEIALSDLFERMHSFTSERSLVFTITECLLDQAFERILESNPNADFTFTNSAFVLNETIT